MAWDFTTDPEFEKTLDWVDEFVRDEVELLDVIIREPRDLSDPVRQELIPPLQDQVREQGLWSAHVPVEFGGRGFTNLELALLNEVLGRSRCAPIVFGCQSPDLGNAEIIAKHGTDEQRRRYLQPLLDGKIVSCFAVTEPQGGADPKVYRTRAELDGDEWVINGEKWFASGAHYAQFLITMAVTEPDNPPYQRMSMFFVPAGTPGITTVRRSRTFGAPEGDGDHSYLQFEDCHVPRENLLGPRGGAFVVMQDRMAQARLAIATRALGTLKRCFDLMCERAISRETQGEMLARKQLVQEMIAESWLEYQQFRLLVLQTAWKLDKLSSDSKAVRVDIAAVKLAAPRVMQNLAQRAAQVHGSLGLSDEMPFMELVNDAMIAAVADGPSEVHKVTLARQAVSGYKPAPGPFPTYHIPALREQARRRYADVLARHGRL
jgi:acyl-CoA dehydrogenase